MPNQQPVITSTKGRTFAGSAVCVGAFIMDDQERLLMLSAPDQDRWEVVNGALEREETLLDGTLREIHEEAGPIQVRPLGVFHAYTFPYDENVQYLLCVCMLFMYEGGEVVPGDDMIDSEVRWFSLNELENGEGYHFIPDRMPWLFRRAVDQYRLLRDRPPVILQPDWGGVGRNTSE